MQDVRPFMQLFRYDPSSKDHDRFQKTIINTKCIMLVEWQEDWDFVAIVCKTDHPEGQETFIEDYGCPAEARKRYQSILTMLGANDGTAYDRERIMKKSVREKAKLDKWIHGLFQKAKAAGYKPFEDEDGDEEAELDSECKNCGGGIKVCCDECEHNDSCEKVYKPEDETDEEADQAEVNPDGGNDTEAPAEPEGHLD